MKILEARLALDLRNALRQFSLYEGSHVVNAIICEDCGINLQYFSYRVPGFLFDTEFEVEIRDDTCDIDSFSIKEGFKRQGYGREMYGILEKFLIDNFYFKRLRVTPSGQAAHKDDKDGKCFWEKMGFVKMDGERSYEKRVG